MSLAIGIVGLPNVGKSTLFRALTRVPVEVANYPFATIEPNVGVVAVPDERLEKLAAFSKSARVVPAIIEFVDIAGLVAGAARGEGLGNQFLARIREVDAIAEVVRVFEDPDIVHVQDRVDALRDLETIELELILKDAETVRRRLETAGKPSKSGEPGVRREEAILRRLADGLDAGRRASLILSSEDRDTAAVLVGELSLLTAKPRIIVFNASEEQAARGWQPPSFLGAVLSDDPWIVLCAKLEDEANALSPEERREYLAAAGITTSGLDAFIRIAYRTLGLITFLTTGEDETRAWTIPAGSSAPRAGRAIHSDFEKKFIRAEVISFHELMEAGSLARARETGRIRTEGKTYLVRDGDVIEFKI